MLNSEEGIRTLVVSQWLQGHGILSGDLHFEYLCKVILVTNAWRIGKGKSEVSGNKTVHPRSTEDLFCCSNQLFASLLDLALAPTSLHSNFVI